MIVKVPYAAFSYATENGTCRPPDLGKELTSMVEGRFRDRFGNAQSGSKWFRRVWFVETTLDSKHFGISLKFLQKTNQWRLVACTLDRPAKFSLLLWHWRIECNVELKIICNEVHDLLSSNPHVSRLRWYFPGDRQSVVAPSNLWVSSVTSSLNCTAAPSSSKHS